MKTFAPTFFSNTGIAQRGIQGELTGHLSVTLVLTLLTFCNKRPNHDHHEVYPPSHSQHTCPPGPELLENASSTSCLGIFVCGDLNFVSQTDALALSSSVTSSVSGGGVGKARDGEGAVKTNREKPKSPNFFKGLWDIQTIIVILTGLHPVYQSSVDDFSVVSELVTQVSVRTRDMTF